MKGRDELKVKDDRLSLRVNSEDKKEIQIRSIDKGFKNLTDYIIYACNKEMEGDENIDLLNSLRYLIEDYAQIRCDIFYLNLTNKSGIDVREVQEFKELQEKKKAIKKELDNILNKLSK